MGADVVFLHDNSLYSSLKDYLGSKRVDVVFEHIGEATWETSMKILNKGGRLVTCGATTGPRVNLNLAHIFYKQISILGSTMSDINTFKEVLGKISKGNYKPTVDEIYRASDVVEAHMRIENRENVGKVVLDFS